MVMLLTNWSLLSNLLLLGFHLPALGASLCFLMSQLTLRAWMGSHPGSQLYDGFHVLMTQSSVPVPLLP